ncbi:VOC family protein [Actinomadura sp. 6N118]|uniref:VOC family protein n=1 Tax=Actinomadura sp. 6N118 TaxID=3375151 RepID=UPI00378D45A1
MRVALIVIYTARLEECRAFYTDLGLPLALERHGQGPEHYAAELDDGTVVELYPAGPRGETGRLRLGFTTVAAAGLEPGRHLLEDPDGRTVELVVMG